MRRRKAVLEVEAGIIDREAAIGIDVASARRASKQAAAEAEAAELDAAEARWEAEKALVGRILELRARLRGEGAALDATGPRPKARARSRPPAAGRRGATDR